MTYKSLIGGILVLAAWPAYSTTITDLDPIRVTSYAQHHPATRNCCPSRSRALTEGRWRHTKHCSMPRQGARGGAGGGLGGSSALDGTNLAGISSHAPSGFSASTTGGGGVIGGHAVTPTSFTPFPIAPIPLKPTPAILWIAALLWLGWRGFRAVRKLHIAQSSSDVLHKRADVNTSPPTQH